MKFVELPNTIAEALECIPAAERGEFLRKNGLRLPVSTSSQKKASSASAQLYTDGASRGNPGAAGAGFFLQDENKRILFEGREYLGMTTNNIAEWTALLLGIKKAQELGIRKLDCFLDSELVVKQMKGEYKVKHPELKPLHEKVHMLVEDFEDISFTHIPREQNSAADQLSNEAIDRRKL